MAKFIIVGGGIAGVTCAETLSFYEPEETILLISESPLIKTVRNLRQLTKTLASFDVEESQLESLTVAHPNVTVAHDSVVHIDTKTRQVRTKAGQELAYEYLCLCSGAAPKIIPQGSQNPLVVGIRDTDSVDSFLEKLQSCRRIAVVGNGGIATELVHKVQGVHVDWIIRDGHVSATFVDPGAAEFFRHHLEDKPSEAAAGVGAVKRLRYEQASAGSGAALGPDWYKSLAIEGSHQVPTAVQVHYRAEVVEVRPGGASAPLELLLTDGSRLHCDLVVSATGVVPRISYGLDRPLELAEDGGILVDEHMRSSQPDVFAAGDICSPRWRLAKHWFPMRLWTHARQTGAYAAKCMHSVHRQQAEDPLLMDFCFELFAHSTRLFGQDVVLLGLYNGQKLDGDYEVLVRFTKGLEYIKFVLKDHRLQGAILVGDTSLAETCENLILNQLDLSPYGDDLLDPNIDIEDYFD